MSVVRGWSSDTSDTSRSSVLVARLEGTWVRCERSTDSKIRSTMIITPANAKMTIAAPSCWRRQTTQFLQASMCSSQQNRPHCPHEPLA